MIITIPSKQAGFIDRTLFFNLSDETFLDEKHIFERADVNIAIILNKAIIGIDLDNYQFYCYLNKTQDWYGPYSTYQELITNLLFGQYDGMFTVLSKVVFNEELGVFEFKLKDFTYNIFDYRVDYMKGLTTIDKIIRVIKEKEVFTFTPETSFSQGVIDYFLNSLNTVFDKNNFPEKDEKNELMDFSVIDRSCVFGSRTPEKFYLIINTDPKRHMVCYLPYWMQKGYIMNENLSSDPDFIKELFDETQTKKITNTKEILLAKKVFGDIIQKEETTLFKVNIYKYLEAVIPIQGTTTVAYILKKDGKYFKLEFDGLLRKFSLKDFEDFYSNNDFQVKVIDGVLFITKKNNFNTKEGFDVVFEGKKELFVNTESGEVRQDDLGYDIRFLSKLEGIV